MHGVIVMWAIHGNAAVAATATSSIRFVWRGRIRRLLFVTGGCIIMTSTRSVYLSVASYIWRYNCIDNSDVSTLEPELESEFYRHVAESEPLLFGVPAGRERAAACLACVLYYYKLLAVEEAACACFNISIKCWLDLVRFKWEDPQQLDFREVTLRDVSFYEALFLLHQFRDEFSALVPPTCGLIDDEDNVAAPMETA